MIELFIFSFNRASQLELLLNSIHAYAHEIFKINIVYTYSEPSYGDAYKILVTEYPKINWLWKDNPKNLTNLPLNQVKSCWISLACDDNIVYRPVPLSNSQLSNVLPKFNDQVFSFRLGYNTIEQDIHRGTKQPPLNLHFAQDGILRWNPHMYAPDHNYGYPFSTDFHVYRSDFLIPILNRCKFMRPNELEGQLQHFRSEINELSSFEQSCVVNVPVNNISGITLANSNGLSLELLNKQFLEGKRISLLEISNYNVKGCHQSIPLVLK